MVIKVSNNITIENPTEAVLEYCNTHLTIDNPTYLIAQKLGKYSNNIPKHTKLYTKKNNAIIVPFGCLKSIWKISKGATLKTEFHEWHNVNYESVSLYDYQQLAVSEMLFAKNGVLQAPCGSGKTRMGIAIISKLKGKALWLTHTHQLLTQSLNAAKSVLKRADFGIISEGKVDISDNITFATVQTMSKLDFDSVKNEFDIVIVDECHRCVGTPTHAKMFYRVITNLNARYKYGLTATPKRSDNLECTMYAVLGDIVYRVNKKVVGDKIIKAEYHNIDIDLSYNLYDYVDYDGTFMYAKLINMLAENDERNNIILNNIILNKERTQIVLCPRREQAKWFYEKLKDYNALLVLGGGKKDFDSFKNYKIIIATEQLAKEGLDYQALDCLHLITPIKNKGMVEQCIGRIERNIENKQVPILYDYVDINIPYCVNAAKIKKRICGR